jgi:hypothetical protein
MANLDDLLTTQKNGVIAINALTEVLANFMSMYENFIGTEAYLGVTESSLVYVGSGRLVNVIVSAAAAGGTVHDAATVATATTANVIFPIPNAVGVVQANVPFLNGLVIRPAAASNVGATYSEA